MEPPDPRTMNLSQLQEHALMLGLDQSGSKQDILERILFELGLAFPEKKFRIILKKKTPEPIQVLEHEPAHKPVFKIKIKKPAPIQAKAMEQAPEPSWQRKDTCYYKLYPQTRSAYLFDFDDTLVKLRTSIPLLNVIPHLIDLYKTHDLVVFSNQAGIEDGKTTNFEVQALMDSFAKQIPAVTISFFYSTANDFYRKPLIGMFELFKSNSLYVPEFYCGDAAGRSADFNISDLYFANNLGIQFKIPEQIFGSTREFKPVAKKIKALYSGDRWEDGVLANPRKIINLVEDDSSFLVESSDPVLIVMVGPQACGKSSLSAKIASSSGKKFGIINGDQLKTKARMVAEFQKLKASGKNIIIDNTNRDLKTRQEWYALASGTYRPIIIFFDLEKEVSFHLINYRMFFGGQKIPTIAVHTYYKNLERPAVSEGTVIKLNGCYTTHEFNQNLRFVWK